MKFGNAWNLGWNLCWTMLFSLVIPLLAGIWLDKRLDTMPLFTLVGAGLGILAATVGVARMALRMFPSTADEDLEQEAEAISEEEAE